MVDSSIEVVHRMRGRVRFVLPPQYLTPGRRAGIASALDAERGVTHYRFNIAGRSLVIGYRGRISVRSLAALIATASERPAPLEVRQPRTRPGQSSLLALAAGGVLALAGQPLAVPLIGVGAAPIFRRAAKRLRRGKVGVDALDATALS